MRPRRLHRKPQDVKLARTPGILSNQATGVRARGVEVAQDGDLPRGVRGLRNG